MASVSPAKNARNIGLDFAFIFMWISSWGLVEMGIEEATRRQSNPKVARLLAYVLILVVVLTILLFVDRNYS